MTSKKAFKKTGCVRGKPGARFCRPTVRLTLAKRQTGCQRGLPGFFLLKPYYFLTLYRIFTISICSICFSHPQLNHDLLSTFFHSVPFPLILTDPTTSWPSPHLYIFSYIKSLFSPLIFPSTIRVSTHIICQCVPGLRS